MNEQYLVVEFAHSVHGCIKRIHVSYKSLAYLLGTSVVLALVVFGLFSAYLQMSWKVSHYNELRADFDRLRNRYQDLQRLSSQHKEQMASLESLAAEVTLAYGISGANQAAGATGGPKVKDSIEQFGYLHNASFSSIYHRYAYEWQAHGQPSLWPIDGVLSSSFGTRSDPFSGEGAFHTGIDLSAPKGTPVHVSADGVVTSTTWAGAYGKLIVVDHGNSVETCYAHLSQTLVVSGQEVVRGQVIALSGATGRATGPHLHYEVRLGGAPVNPYRYLGRPRPTPKQVASLHRLQSDLGL